MVSAEKYVGKVEEIYQEDPDYESGGDGSGHKCDCIGMCRGALERAGEKNVHNMRGTNNAVRHLDLNLQQLTGSSQLQLGDIVMRTRDKDDKNMRLKPRRAAWVWAIFSIIPGACSRSSSTNIFDFWTIVSVAAPVGLTATRVPTIKNGSCWGRSV